MSFQFAYGRIYGERDLIVASKVSRLLRVRRAAEIDFEAIIDVTDRPGLRIAVFSDSRDRCRSRHRGKR